MSILNIVTSQTGLVGVLPSIAYINTSDTEATVLTTGYLNQAVEQGFQFSIPCMACVSTRTSPNAIPDVGWFEVQHSGSNWSLISTVSPGDVTLPTIANHIATYTNTNGGLGEDAGTAINGGNIQAGLSGTAGYLASFPGTALMGSLRVQAANSAGNFITTITNASMAAARTYTIPDGGQSASNFIMSDSAGTQTIATGNLALTLGNITVAAGNIAATLGTVSGVNGTFNKVSNGATPAPLVDPASCTISGAAGATNTCTVTIQLKDGSGTNIARSVPFKVYSSSASNGLTLQSAASTGYSVASGGISLSNGTAVTTQISGVTSATGGCVLSLLDTGKQTSFLVLVLDEGIKISAQLTSGSYG